MSQNPHFLSTRAYFKGDENDCLGASAMFTELSNAKMWLDCQKMSKNIINKGRNFPCVFIFVILTLLLSNNNNLEWSGKEGYSRRALENGPGLSGKIKTPANKQRYQR